MSQQTLRILIADDEPLHNAALSAQLQLLGHHVVAVATTGDQAVELAAQLEPDLLILDARLPGLSGPEAARSIVAHRPVPIIIVSLYDDARTVQEVLNSPAMALLLKPVDVDDLRLTIAMTVQRFRDNLERERRVAELEEKLEARRVIERAKGLIMQHRGLSEEAAYALLRRESQNRGLPMKVLAEHLINGMAALSEVGDGKSPSAASRHDASYRALRRPTSR